MWAFGGWCVPSSFGCLDMYFMHESVLTCSNSSSLDFKFVCGCLSLLKRDIEPSLKTQLHFRAQGYHNNLWQSSRLPWNSMLTPTIKASNFATRAWFLGGSCCSCKSRIYFPMELSRIINSGQFCCYFCALELSRGLFLVPFQITKLRVIGMGFTHL